MSDLRLRVRRYAPADAPDWDALVRDSRNGTFMHTRRFLSYHGDRFDDRSLLIDDDRDRLLGVLPAAAQPGEDGVVTSHPGATYGGLVHAGKLTGERMIEALREVAAHFAREGQRELRYKAVPSIYHRVPAGDDLYAMFRLGAVRYRCDLSSTIDLPHRPKPSSRRRRGRKGAEKAGVRIERGARYLPELWPVLEDNLRRKHDAAPVHSLQEIQLLQERFPEQIDCVVALLDGEVVAGTVLFAWQQVVHAQYIAASEQGYEVSALDAVFEHCIRRCGDEGRRYFDFGISNERQGRYLNQGLHRFKSEFGAGGVPYEFYRLSLDGDAATLEDEGAGEGAHAG